MNYKQAWNELKKYLIKQKKKYSKEYKDSKKKFHKADKYGDEEVREISFSSMERSGILIIAVDLFLNFMKVLEKHLKEEQ